MQTAGSSTSPDTAAQPAQSALHSRHLASGHGSVLQRDEEQWARQDGSKSMGGGGGDIVRESAMSAPRCQGVIYEGSAELWASERRERWVLQSAQPGMA
jgi:hypothetical protein